MIKPPSEIKGNSDWVAYFNGLVRYIRSLRPVASSSSTPNHTHDGVSWDVDIPVSASAGATLDAFFYQSSMGDYIWCTDVKLPPATGVTPKYTPIAKVPKLRNSILTETIDGTVVSYAYDAYTTVGQKYLRRDATIPANSATEKQDINPRFLANDKIYAMKVTGGTGLKTEVGDSQADSLTVPQDILYIDMNIDARAWTQRDDQST